MQATTPCDSPQTTSLRQPASVPPAYDKRPPASPGAAPPTSLDPLGTNRHAPSYDDVDQHPLAVQSREQHRVHWRHRHPRHRVITALWMDGSDALAKKARKLADCCQTPMIGANTAGDPVLLLGCCRDRLCPRCQKARAAKMHTRTLDLVRRMDARRFMTLTRPHQDTPLGVQLDELIAAFRQLRRLAVWRKHVAGGVWALEITYNAERNEWHPHIHIICDGCYFPHAELKAAWSEIIGSESIVDIRKCDDARDAARYISSYVGKLADLANVPHPRIAEYATALHRRRLAGTFGRSHAVTLQRKDDTDEPQPAEFLLAAYQLSNRALAGDADAGFAICVLCEHGGRWCDVFGERYQPPHAETGSEAIPGVEHAMNVIRAIAANPNGDDDGQTTQESRPPPRPPPLLPYE